MNKKFFGNRLITISALILVVFGSIMIVSAEMGNSVGANDYLISEAIKQGLFALVGIGIYFLFMNVRIYKVSIVFFWCAYIVILFLLIACRFFGEINGAYAWIPIGGIASIQPSEFAKTFLIIFGAKLFGVDRHDNNSDSFYKFIACAGLYLIIIFAIQNDLGSAVVLALICFCICFIPPYKELKKIQKGLFICILAGIGVVLLILTPIGTKIISKLLSGYKAARFLVAADPFAYRYDNGYHIVMSLVSFANGNIFGLGYGNSIHKYMNFPNPSNDFILPVIVEELGIIGFIGLVILYACLLLPIARASINSKYISSKLILIGTFVYFVSHIILNVGGVSGFIPLTGVPLLLISSGGSSLVASMAALGLSQNEIKRNYKEEFHESNSGQI